MVVYADIVCGHNKRGITILIIHCVYRQDITFNKQTKFLQGCVCASSLEFYMEKMLMLVFANMLRRLVVTMIGIRKKEEKAVVEVYK
jgi:hypothetical protein